MSFGRVHFERFESAVLRGNAAGDSHVRQVPVYLPPSYDASPQRRYPVVFVLGGFTSRGRTLLNDNGWSPGLDDRMNGLIAGGRSREMILVMPDCFTRFGGSQYLNSSATGRYEDHVVLELVPWVDRTFRTMPGRDHRGLAGKSSGGYGAVVLGMRHADVFGAIACHSGDMCFEYCYRGDIPKMIGGIQRGGGLERWMQTFEAAVQKKHDDLTVLNMIAMAASYSPNPATKPFGIDFPCNLETGAFREDVWRRWLEHDPLTLVERHAAALSSLRLLYLDCGVRDEWFLHLGARLFVQRLKDLGIAHHHEEFDDGHMSVQYRYDVSLPLLAVALGAT